MGERPSSSPALSSLVSEGTSGRFNIFLLWGASCLVRTGLAFKCLLKDLCAKCGLFTLSLRADLYKRHSVESSSKARTAGSATSRYKRGPMLIFMGFHEKKTKNQQNSYSIQISIANVMPECISKDTLARLPLSPQLSNDDKYCLDSGP